MHPLLQLLLASLAVAVASMTASKGAIFRGLRKSLKDSDWRIFTFLGRLLNCPFCTSFWLAAPVVFILREPVFHGVSPVFDGILRWLLLVFGAAIGSGVIFRCYAPMNTTED